MVGGQQERRGAVMVVSCKDRKVGSGLADFGGDSRVKSSINSLRQLENRAMQLTGGGTSADSMEQGSIKCPV
ncbi:hypothetical protein FOPG_07853 [Fusarium oxysporum f. sp. conglutinans race 2 54008]|uniref:Uncharacterized protein n=1 Tax=Fusarium oxysporum f. sp. conglutinans race 2 54008 TaxID=1089457 RepID=X0I0P2_FUSOX|nr:hypothetical protein FOPG_07853 [Fusarium oxysporum f. sp. conglutinans race 2 54008]KAI8414949.1 hypothetical protein FOFC_04568 [Fusarium oxysporum]